jgi:hypothetical protein
LARKYKRYELIEKLSPVAAGVVVPNRELH